MIPTITWLGVCPHLPPLKVIGECKKKDEGTTTCILITWLILLTLDIAQGGVVFSVWKQALTLSRTAGLASKMCTNVKGVKMSPGAPSLPPQQKVTSYHKSLNLAKCFKTAQSFRKSFLSSINIWNRGSLKGQAECLGYLLGRRDIKHCFNIIKTDSQSKLQESSQLVNKSISFAFCPLFERRLCMSFPYFWFWESIFPSKSLLPF